MTQDPPISKQQKWQQYYSQLDCCTESIPSPAKVLADYHYLLPQQGDALDLACGLAGNAFFMAQRGLVVHAWDSSESVLQHVADIAKQHVLKVSLNCQDIEQRPPSPKSFDVIVVSRFLSRPLCVAIMSSLRPNGLLFYQTFIADKVDAGGPSKPAYLLQKNELLHLFSNLTLLVYLEQGSVGDIEQGFRNEALLVARKESS